MWYPSQSHEYWQMLAWVNNSFTFIDRRYIFQLIISQLSWQIAGQGPMMGQAAHFVRYAPESVPYGINRYTAECRRLFHVLEKQLVSFI